MKKFFKVQVVECNEEGAPLFDATPINAVLESTSAYTFAKHAQSAGKSYLSIKTKAMDFVIAEADVRSYSLRDMNSAPALERVVL